MISNLRFFENPRSSINPRLNKKQYDYVITISMKIFTEELNDPKYQGTIKILFKISENDRNSSNNFKNLR